MKRMLVVFPHPDDESFATGGTIAKYAKNGWMIHLLCITRGQKGSSEQYPSGEKLGMIRSQELENAASILGISHVQMYDFIDGKLKTIARGELEDRIFKDMTRIVPDIVITYEPGGISNHPDHIRLTNAVTYAFQKYAKSLVDLSRFEELKGIIIRDLNRLYRKSFDEVGASGGDPRLYYACMPKSVGEYVVKQKRFPALSFDKPWSMIPDDKITTVIDIKKFTSKKIQALGAHQTQYEDVSRFLADIPHNPLLSQEYYILRMVGLTEVFMGKNDRVSNKL